MLREVFRSITKRPRSHYKKYIIVPTTTSTFLDRSHKVHIVRESEVLYQLVDRKSMVERKKSTIRIDILITSEYCKLLLLQICSIFHNLSYWKTTL